MAGPLQATSVDRQIVSFPEWKETLAAEAFAPGEEFTFRQEIFAFLHHCKTCHAGASIILVQQYLPIAEAQGLTRPRGTLPRGGVTAVVVGSAAWGFGWIILR